MMELKFDRTLARRGKLWCGRDLSASWMQFEARRTQSMQSFSVEPVKIFNHLNGPDD